MFLDFIHVIYLNLTAFKPLSGHFTENKTAEITDWLNRRRLTSSGFLVTARGFVNVFCNLTQQSIHQIIVKARTGWINRLLVAVKVKECICISWAADTSSHGTADREEEEEEEDEEDALPCSLTWIIVLLGQASTPHMSPVTNKTLSSLSSFINIILLL